SRAHFTSTRPVFATSKAYSWEKGDRVNSTMRCGHIAPPHAVSAASRSTPVESPYVLMSPATVSASSTRGRITRRNTPMLLRSPDLELVERRLAILRPVEPRADDEQMLPEEAAVVRPVPHEDVGVGARAVRVLAQVGASGDLHVHEALRHRRD